MTNNVAVPLLEGDDVGCPLGWLPTDTSCYWISNTTDPSQRKNWTDAKTQCNTLFAGATLMTIDNAQDQVLYLKIILSVLSMAAPWPSG